MRTRHEVLMRALILQAQLMREVGREVEAQRVDQEILNLDFAWDAHERDFSQSPFFNEPRRQSRGSETSSDNSELDDKRIAVRSVLTNAIEVTGGVPLVGTVEIAGAKNLATKALVASLLGSTPSTLRNVPDIGDVEVVKNLLQVHGVEVTSMGPGKLLLDPTNLALGSNTEIDVYSGSSRVPILFCGPLLHRFGQAFLPDLGGCSIGDRPIDFHLDALRSFGADVEKLPSGINITAPRGLKGTSIELPYPSVGATEQVLLTAVLAEGTTELRNAALEPEIMDLIGVLQQMGAQIFSEPNRQIRIEGVNSLSGFDHRVMFDRNEAVSWAFAALATGGDIICRGAKQQELTTFLNVFNQIGGSFQIVDEGIRFYHPGGNLRSVEVETDVHPGFMTDWQPPLIVALTQAHGTSTIHETVYENRFGFTKVLVEMGARIDVFETGVEGGRRRVPRRALEQTAVVIGPTTLRGVDMKVPDIRAGFSYLIAALTADGVSTISNIKMLTSGYDDLLVKLVNLGATFEILDDSSMPLESVPA